MRSTRKYIPVTKLCLECGKKLYGYRPLNKTQIESVDGIVIGKPFTVKGLPIGYAHVECLEEKVKI